MKTPQDRTGDITYSPAHRDDLISQEISHRMCVPPVERITFLRRNRVLGNVESFATQPACTLYGYDDGYTYVRTNDPVIIIILIFSTMRLTVIYYFREISAPDKSRASKVKLASS